MPVVTFTIFALLPFFRNTTLASFSRSSFCAAFSARSLTNSALLSPLSRCVDLLLFLFDLFRTQIAVAGANGHGLHRHGDDVLHHVGLDVGRAT